MKQPIIFIGMHRSGTSLLGQSMQTLGLFSGKHRNQHDEALFFKNLNDWILLQSGARWDNPQPLDDFWSNSELVSWSTDYLQTMLQSPRSSQFVGIKRYLLNQGIGGLTQPWGWKDPRNTFTLPLWLRIFPEAKVVAISRHGIDVAESLRSRNRRGFEHTTKKYRKFRWLVALRAKRGGFLESARCADLSGGFSLWEEYMDKIADLSNQIPESRLLNVKYESLLTDSVTELQRCAKFCGLNPNPLDIAELAKEFDYSRANAYLQCPQLTQFAVEKSASLASRGYE